MRILPAWLREFVNIKVDDRQLAEDLTSAGIAVESIVEENGATIFEMDLTTNRVDAMNHYGVAREASAIYNVELKKVEPKLPKATSPRAAGWRAPLGMTSFADELNADPGVDTFPIVIEDARGLRAIHGAHRKNVKIGPSARDIAQRLELLGSRPINNVADATNYALNELGHPTHAFDLDLLEGGTIIVRRARAGETLKTLDGIDRTLTTDDLVIADAQEASRAGRSDGRLRHHDYRADEERADRVGMVRSGDGPQHGQASRHAHRRLASLRARRRLGHHAAGLRRVAELILASAGGELHGERIDAVARKLERARLCTAPFRGQAHSRHRSWKMPRSQRILQRLGIRRATHASGGDFSVATPTWRLDVEREVDLLEELARIYGYNKFPNTLPAIHRRSGRAAGRTKERQGPRDHARARLRRGDLHHLHLRAGSADLRQQASRWPLPTRRAKRPATCALR